MDREPLTTLDDKEFSLVLGGPLYQIFLRTRLVRPPMGLVHRRILVCLLITYLVPAVLSMFEGTFLGNVKVPFLYDLGNLRFVIALPFLLGAELIVHRRMQFVVAQFSERELVLSEDRPRFLAIIDRAMRFRNSVVAEVVLLALAFVESTH